MAYLHCHTKGCGWSQDDFWEKDGYTPLNKDVIEHLKEHLFKDKIYGDKYMFEDHEIPYKIDGNNNRAYSSGTDYVAGVLKSKANSIRNMDVKTYEQWKRIKGTWKCPKCGEHNPDID